MLFPTWHAYVLAREDRWFKRGAKEAICVKMKKKTSRLDDPNDDWTELPDR